MKYENFEEAKGLIETIDEYKGILKNIEEVTCDFERDYIDTKLQVVNFVTAEEHDTVTTKLEITDMPRTFAMELIESYKEYCQIIVDLSMKELEKL
jgi:hypothetical protein